MEDCRAVDMPLAAFEEGFHIRHHRFQVLALVQEHAIPVGNLVFPVLLPLAQRRLLQQPVSLDDEPLVRQPRSQRVL